MNESEIAALTNDPWRNVNIVALRVALAHLTSTEKPVTVTVRKTRNPSGSWLYAVDVQHPED